MKLVHGCAAMALLVAAAPAAATEVFSGQTLDGNYSAFSYTYAAPAAGYQQSYQLTYSGLSLDTAVANRVQYLLDRIMPSFKEGEVFNDGFVFDEGCYVPVAGSLDCEKRSDGYGKFPEVSFLEHAASGVITFTIRNEPYYEDPSCTLPGSCYLSYGFSDGSGKIYGIFAPGEVGDYEFTVFDPVAIPEPATWAVMVLGFGLAGSALRRRASPARA
jgi:hypothetical protein